MGILQWVLCIRGSFYDVFGLFSQLACSTSSRARSSQCLPHTLLIQTYILIRSADGCQASFEYVSLCDHYFAFTRRVHCYHVVLHVRGGKSSMNPPITSNFNIQRVLTSASLVGYNTITNQQSIIQSDLESGQTRCTQHTVVQSILCTFAERVPRKASSLCLLLWINSSIPFFSAILSTSVYSLTYFLLRLQYQQSIYIWI